MEGVYKGPMQLDMVRVRLAKENRSKDQIIRELKQQVNRLTEQQVLVVAIYCHYQFTDMNNYIL